jgi:3-oxoacyl-[acyl-carrier protein] reductase
MSKLTGKVAVVTGASKGIGAGIAKAFAAEGASVVVNYSSSKSGAEAVVAEITKAGGKAIAVQGSVAVAADVIRLFEETKKAYGKVDVLVNNAGVFAFSPIEAFDETEFHREFNTNVLGVLLSTREALKLFPAEGGSVINISSAVSKILPPNSSTYTATKGAVDAITGVLANELGAKKVRVNSINPGVIDTEGAQSLGIIGSDWEKTIIAQTPLGRSGTPEDLNPIAVFLASDDSRWITGETLVASGGLR